MRIAKLKLIGLAAAGVVVALTVGGSLLGQSKVREAAGPVAPVGGGGPPVVTAFPELIAAAAKEDDPAVLCPRLFGPKKQPTPARADIGHQLAVARYEALLEVIDGEFGMVTRGWNNDQVESIDLLRRLGELAPASDAVFDRPEDKIAVRKDAIVLLNVIEKTIAARVTAGALRPYHLAAVRYQRLDAEIGLLKLVPAARR